MSEPVQFFSNEFKVLETPIGTERIPVIDQGIELAQHIESEKDRKQFLQMLSKVYSIIINPPYIVQGGEAE